MDVTTQNAIAQAMAVGNINIADENMEVLDLSERSLAAQERQAQAQLELEIQRRARTVHVPTNEMDVKLRLRELGHPICLFGERAGDRRRRLREIIARGMVDAEAEQELDQAEGVGAGGGGGRDVDMGSGDQAARKEVSYYVPPTADQLKRARMAIADFSFPRARRRLREERRLQDEFEARREADAAATELVNNVKALQPSASQVGDSRRPLSTCAMSRDGSVIATGSWSGLVRLWNRDCSARLMLRGHTERVCDVDFHPSCDGTASTQVVQLASAGADAVCHLWALGKAEPVASLRGHAARLARVRFHPSGTLAATTSFDKTWRLWDVERSQCLQLQEGHSKEAYALAMHCDGSLVGTGDLGGVGRVWDLRSGKSVLVLPGHVKQMLSLDFSPDGYHLATGSDDHTVRVWDLRKRDCVYVIPAHTSLISTVKFAPKTGEFLITSSFDGTIKAWSGRDWSPLGEFTGHEGKISCVDVAQNERSLVSCSFDRTFKLWTSFDDDDAAAAAKADAAAAEDVTMA